MKWFVAALLALAVLAACLAPATMPLGVREGAALTSGAPQTPSLVAQAASSELAAALAKPRTGDGAEIELGRKVWNFRCYYCHGYSGDAKTLAATFTTPAPRDFTAPEASGITRERIIEATRNGRPGTAMAAFSKTLSEREIAAVADFVRDEFIARKAANTRYHTAEAGWPDHDRYRDAYPFARGEIPLDAPEDSLTDVQRKGRGLFMSSCVSCHDRAKATGDGVAWELRAVSYPPNVDACTGCHRYSVDLHPGTPAPHPPYSKVGPAQRESPYAMHDAKPVVANMSAAERRGEQLFQRNCTFCHAADGTGKNWIGAFLEPHPRDLTDREFRARTTRVQLAAAIRDGLAGTSMPAWKDVMSEREIQAIAAYVARAFGEPLRKE